MCYGRRLLCCGRADGTVVQTGSGGRTNDTNPFFRNYGPDLTGLFLGDGDVITTTIDGIGTITNRCRRLPDHPYAATIPAGWRPAWKASTTDD